MPRTSLDAEHGIDGVQVERVRRQPIERIGGYGDDLSGTDQMGDMRNPFGVGAITPDFENFGHNSNSIAQYTGSNASLSIKELTKGSPSLLQGRELPHQEYYIALLR